MGIAVGWGQGVGEREKRGQAASDQERGEARCGLLLGFGQGAGWAERGGNQVLAGLRPSSRGFPFFFLFLFFNFLFKEKSGHR